jgi:hypothetical protein
LPDEGSWVRGKPRCAGNDHAPREVLDPWFENALSFVNANACASCSNLHDGANERWLRATHIEPS